MQAIVSLILLLVIAQVLPWFVPELKVPFLMAYVVVPFFILCLAVYESYVAWRNRRSKRE